MRMEIRNQRGRIRMGKKMDYGLCGMKMERRVLKDLSMTGKKMDYGLNGQKKERKSQNKNGKMVKRNGGN